MRQVVSDSLSTVLPDWHDGHIRIIDIIPAEPLAGPALQAIAGHGGMGGHHPA